MLFNKIVLYSVKQLKGERSPVAIYHLLMGKKSIQTVQDAHIYGLSSYYGLLPKLQISFFEDRINFLVASDFIKIDPSNFVAITRSGHCFLKEQSSLEIKGFNGMKYHQRDIQFMNRLLLFIQIISNSKMGNYNYLPIVEEKEYTSWARKIYHKIRDDLYEVASLLEKEIITIGEQLPEEEINLFVDRLTGYQIYGKSIDQLSNKYNCSPIQVQLLLVKITHIMMDLILGKKEEFIVLHQILPRIEGKSFLTKSAEKTYRLFTKGKGLQQIANTRKLKPNTIEDHMVEISLHDKTFPYEQFLSPKVEEEIFQAFENLKTFKLKEIKEQVNKNISYFEIRLALSKYNQNKDED